jgi:hypothetical protein
MDPMIRLSIFLSRLWRNPPPRRTLLFMLGAVVAALAVVAVDKLGYWPAEWRLNPPVNRPGMSRF